MNAQLQQPAGEILLNVPAEEYHRRELGVASNTAMKILREKSPAHLKAWAESDDDKTTPALDFGRAYHCRVLEPALYAERYVVIPDFGDMRSSKNREKRDAFKDSYANAEFIDAETSARIEAMHAALMAHPVAAGIMRDGESEVTMRWHDALTGVPCKARADWWKRGRFFMDLKTTEDASPEGFRRAIARYGYHVQHAHYCDGAQACGEPVTNYLILAQEKEPPYVPAVYHIDAASEIRGYELRQQALETMRNCIDSGEWPGYGSGITELTLPAWAFQD